MSAEHAPVVTPLYTLLHGDSVHALAALADAGARAALSVTSIPFADLFAYTKDQADLGNNRPEAFWYGFRCLAAQWVRAMAPGRVVAIHCTQLKAYKVLHEFMGLRDFVGDVVRVMTDAGFEYRGDVTIAKNPQSVAQRMHDHNLLFTTFRKDRAQVWPTRNDYVLIFGAPGANEVPVISDELSVETWIRDACGVWKTAAEGPDLVLPFDTWDDISEGDVLRQRGAGGEDDTKHVCPLQLEVIRRCVLLWSNPGELVLDPFNGIGSTSYVAVKAGRRALGIDLKADHHKTAVANMRALDRELAAKAAQGDLFGAKTTVCDARSRRTERRA